MPKIPQIPAVIVDSRESKPYLFENIYTKHKGQRVLVPVEVQVKKLNSGDYSLLGYEDQVSVERKSVNDLVSTIFHSRPRFERELERLSEMMFSAVVVEGSWLDVMKYTRDETSGNPRSIDASITAWMIRHPMTHWCFRPSRRYAENLTFRILDRFFKEAQANADRPLSR